MNFPVNPVLEALPANLMVQLDERRKALLAQGKRLFDFGLGDPLEPTPSFIRDAMVRAVPEISQYPNPYGTESLRAAAVAYLKRRFGLRLDPDTQIVPATGAKETIFHLPLAFANPAGPRRKVVMPDPGYPTYEVGTRFAGLTPVKHPLTARNRFLLEPDEVGEATLRETLIFWISYPHNPTGAVAGLDYYRRVAEASQRYGFIVASDECYADIHFGEPPPTMLQASVEGVLAIHSCSKRSGMTGYRTGFVAGDAALCSALRRTRAHLGVASPDFVTAAAVAAWSDDAHAAERREIFRRKRDAFMRFFQEVGISCDGSEGTLYLWVRVPQGFTSISYAERLLAEGIVVTPGPGFGAGEGYVRVALVPSLADCQAAIARWPRVGR
jgi:acetylornithine aminotransferase